MSGAKGSKGPKGAKEAKSVRCVKDYIEEEIYLKRRNLLTQISMAYFDTTSIYFEGKGGIDIGRRGHSKDHRTDLKQAVVGVVLDNHGFPVCTEIWPGNTADVTTLVPVAKRLRSGFGITRVCILADRGMISKNIIEQITNMGWTYILGVKMRNNSVVPDLFQDDAPFIEVVKPREHKHDPAPLKVKEVINSGNRYVICFNEEEAENDRYTRKQIITNL
jgi:transposase